MREVTLNVEHEPEPRNEPPAGGSRTGKRPRTAAGRSLTSATSSALGRCPSTASRASVGSGATC